MEMRKKGISLPGNDKNILMTYTLKSLSCLNPTLGQIWTNSNVGLKM